MPIGIGPVPNSRPPRRGSELFVMMLEPLPVAPRVAITGAASTASWAPSSEIARPDSLTLLVTVHTAPHPRRPRARRIGFARCY